MIDSITSVLPVRPLEPGAADSRKPAQAGFQQALQSALERVEAADRHSAGQIDRFLSGEGGDLHSIAIAAQRSALQFETFLQMRNKVVQAYQEVMRMQL
jgi:flagellar hook-basal body complex protein FliE